MKLVLEPLRLQSHYNLANCFKCTHLRRQFSKNSVSCILRVVNRGEPIFLPEGDGMLMHGLCEKFQQYQKKVIKL
ncbi:hypothetical protein LCGC14_2248700 [marine sediment metagenome]|uniref:Uncharacterized protein n=1 Tax=marine sediment metagenome TaxID=412755 RepID=A0A0F9D2Z6_9ZZZZ